MNILIVGPGGDNCTLEREYARGIVKIALDEVRGSSHDLIDSAPDKLNAKSPGDIVVAFQETGFRLFKRVGPENVAESIRIRLARIVPVIILPTEGKKSVTVVEGPDCIRESRNLRSAIHRAIRVVLKASQE